MLYIKHEFRDRPDAPLITEENLAKVSESMCITYSMQLELFKRFAILIGLALDYKQQRLRWIFNKQDTNQNDKWNKLFDFNPFIKEIHHLENLRQVNSDIIFTLIDTDEDNLISQTEWLSFFDNNSMMPRNLLEVMKEFVNKLRKQ